jgi:hypothetical protein
MRAARTARACRHPDGPTVPQRSRGVAAAAPHNAAARQRRRRAPSVPKQPEQLHACVPAQQAVAHTTA